jgi:large subunit ribosomal protein L3
MTTDSKVHLPVIIGKKAGMTRIFDENGIEIVPNIISQVKTKDKDGYEAYQVAYYEKREKLVNSPTKGTLKKAGINKFLARFTEIEAEGTNKENLGKELSLEEFKPATYVDVTGTSKGKGTQGVVKRFGFRGGPATHGSHFHRRPGSIGCRATPARVFKGKKMPGNHGQDQVTIQNLVVVEVQLEKGYLLIKGAVPGAKNSFVRISKAVKA